MRPFGVIAFLDFLLVKRRPGGIRFSETRKVSMVAIIAHGRLVMRPAEVEQVKAAKKALKMKIVFSGLILGIRETAMVGKTAMVGEVVVLVVK